MHILNKFTIFCSFCIVISKSYGCETGSECIDIKRCYGLLELQKYENIGMKRYIQNFTKALRCDNEGNELKVCCPPHFKIQTTYSPIPSRSNLLPSTEECGIASSNDRIVGGSQTELDEHPWLALLKYRKPKSWGFHCAGALISPRYVLTAAHCAKGQEIPATWRLYQVRLGEWNITSEIDCIGDDCSSDVLDIPIEEIITHPDYSKSHINSHNDIALLRLEKPVKYSEFIRPICLPVSNELRHKTFTNEEMEVAGWGRTENRSVSDVKLKVVVPVVDPTTCANIYRTANRAVTSNQLCAGGRTGEDSCRGDSGGPLMGKLQSGNWVITGIVSYGPTPCGLPNWPSIYTRVGAYVDWIIATIRP